MHREVAEARLYCAGVAGVRARKEKGSVAIDFRGGVRAGIRTRRKGMKKIGFLTLLLMAMFLLILAFPAAATGPNTPAPPLPVAAVPASPTVAVVAPALPPHPRIHEAIEMMRGAREHLAHAEGEFHGHRDRAIEHLDRAIRQAEEAEHTR
jgi:hypothetical protein